MLSATAAAAAARRRACSLFASSSSPSSSSPSSSAMGVVVSLPASLSALFSTSSFSAAAAAAAADPPARAPSPASRAPAKTTTSEDPNGRDTPYGPGPSADSVLSRETTRQGQAFVGDLRGASALGLGDGITDHTAKWMQTDGPLSGNTKPPMDFIAEAPPIKVHGAVVASTGSEDPALGCPVEFIDLRGTSRERPAVCKYTGNRYYSDDWAGAH